jgi:hypothetical protein
MAFNELLLITKQNVAAWYAHAMDIMSDPRIAYGKYISIGLAVLLVCTGGFFGYRWYVTHRDQAAQYDFGVTLDLYVKAQESKDADFVYIAEQAEEGYTKHKRSAVAPFFIVLQADALIKAGKKEEARLVMDAYAPQLSAPAPMAFLFKTKQSLLSLDSADEQVRNKGLSDLQELAHNAKNMYRDDALYQLFTYHWVRGDVDQARIAGQEFMEAYGAEMRAPSPWLAVVAEKLDTLGAVA